MRFPRILGVPGLDRSPSIVRHVEQCRRVVGGCRRPSGVSKSVGKGLGTMWRVTIRVVTETGKYYQRTKSYNTKTIREPGDPYSTNPGSFRVRPKSEHRSTCRRMSKSVEEYRRVSRNVGGVGEGLGTMQRVTIRVVTPLPP